jgi:peptide-methionine (R)-S-oxide reductase
LRERATPGRSQPDARRGTLEAVFQPVQREIPSRRALLLAPISLAGAGAVLWIWGKRTPSLNGVSSGASPGDTALEVTIVQFSPAGEPQGAARVGKIVRSDAEWFTRLSHEQYYVTRRKNTDTPFSGTYYRLHDRGLYRCICCDTALFSSAAKYDSGTGWPSFWEPIAKENIRASDEAGASLASGIEVRCTRCDAHLGHIFDDGPEPTHLRYCINESSLRFVALPS